MAKSVVLYGPASGRSTSHGAAIAASLGLHHVIALEDVQMMGERLQRKGFLYLSSSESYAQRAANLLGTKVVHVSHALAAIDVNTKEVAHD